MITRFSSSSSSSSSFSIFLTIIFLSSSTTRALTATSRCYNPDGSLAASGNYPCFLGQENSPCCGGGQVCEASGLCKVPDSVGVSDLIRGTCTDSSWQSNECPQYCLQATTGGTNLISCQNVTSSDLDFCCDHTNGCCDSGIARFQVADNVDVITLGASGALSSVVDPTSSSASSQTTPAAASTTSTKESSTITSSTTTAPIAATSSSSSLPTISSGFVASGLSGGAKAGIGIGCGIAGLGLIIGVVYFLLMRRKKSRAAELDGNREGVPGTVEIGEGIPVSELEHGNRNATGEVLDYYAAQKRGLLRGRETEQAVELPNVNEPTELS